MDGIINVYKEKGYTSHDAVARMRGISGQRRVGHTGTLDPDAEGVLPICLGTATKVCDILTDKSKVYETVLLLGIGTDTEDISGDVTMTGSDRVVALTDEEIVSAINSFVGTYMQLPPMFSAIKCNGQKLCDLARVGKEVERIPRKVDITSIGIVSDIVRGRLGDVTVYRYNQTADAGTDTEQGASKAGEGKTVLTLSEDSMLGRYGEGIDYTSESGRFRRDNRNVELADDRYASLPVIRVALRIECSKGTYIRSLCRDIGERLGSHGCIEKLLRTRVGDFRIEDAVRLEEAEQLVREGRFLEAVRPSDACFSDLKSLHMKAKFDYVLYNGNVMFFRYFSEYIKEPPTPVKVYSSQGEFLAVYEFEERRKLYKPLKMFTTEADQERGGNPEKKTGSMKLIDNRDFSLQDTAVSIGKFDTVHKGHRFLIDSLVKLAKGKGLSSVALALDFKNGFNGDNGGTRIDSWDKTAERFKTTGIDVLIRYGFDSTDAMATPEEFVREVLVDKLGCRLAVVGDDFRFGRDRQGNTDTLKLLGEQYGFETVVVKRLEVEGVAVSSSRIRKLINEGNASEADKFL